MAKKRKNLGKVKRYRHNSFHAKRRTARNIILWILLIVMIGGGSYLLAPRIIDFGTSTWYSLTDGLGDFSVPTPESTPEIVEEVEATPEPTIEPTPIATIAVIDGTWADVSLSALTTPELIAETVSSLSAQGVTYVVVPLKDTSGYIHYASSLENSTRSIASTCIDAAAVATAISDAGMIAVASLATFQDPISVYQNRDMGIGYQATDYMWLDNTADAGGKAWMNPYSDISVTFIGDLIAEVSYLGYSQVVLSQVQFPSQVSASQDYGNIGEATRADALRNAIAAWDARFADQDVILWVEYDYATCAEVSNITGDLPSTLGITNAIINLPLATEDDMDPDTSLLDSMVAAFMEGGTEYVVVAENGAADFY